MRVKLSRALETLTLTAMVASAAAACAPSPPSADVTTASTIIGGRPASDRAIVRWGWMKPGGHDGMACTATLVAPNVLLTAAHCQEGAPQDAQFVVELDGNLTPVARANVHPHPQYAGTVNDQGAPSHDIAVVVLDAPASATPVPLYTATPPASWVGTKVRLVGQGATDERGQVSDGTMREVTATVRQVSPILWIGERGKQACMGDSGGPALVSVGGKEYVFGVVSTGPNGGSICNDGGYYERIDTHVAFLTQYLTGGSGPGVPPTPPGSGGPGGPSGPGGPGGPSGPGGPGGACAFADCMSVGLPPGICVEGWECDGTCVVSTGCADNTGGPFGPGSP